MALGNVLRDMYSQAGGTTKKHLAPCNKILNVLRVAARALDTECPIGCLTKNMIGLKKPRLKVKAAECRYLVPIVAYALEHLWDIGDEYNRLRFYCIQALRNCYAILANWEMNGISRRQLIHEGRRFLMLYCELAKSSPKNRWHLVPKHHLFIHLIEEGGDTNPRLEWNYSDESEIGDSAIFSKFCSAKDFATAFITRYAASY